jgi:hypothetical protein
MKSQYKVSVATVSVVSALLGEAHGRWPGTVRFITIFPPVGMVKPPASPRQKELKPMRRAPAGNTEIRTAKSQYQLSIPVGP